MFKLNFRDITITYQHKKLFFMIHLYCIDQLHILQLYQLSYVTNSISLFNLIHIINNVKNPLFLRKEYKIKLLELMVIISSIISVFRIKETYLPMFALFLLSSIIYFIFECGTGLLNKKWSLLTAGFVAATFSILLAAFLGESISNDIFTRITLETIYACLVSAIIFFSLLESPNEDKNI